MPVSHLDNSVAEILAFGLNEATGGSYSHLTTSEDQMLALLVSEMTGQEYLHLTTGRETLWELLLTQAAADGITFDRNTQSNEQIAAIIANNVSAGGGEEYEGPLDLVPGAVVAYGMRALSTAMLGQPLYTIKRDSDATTQVFNADAVTGAAPVASTLTFIGSPFVRTGAVENASNQIVLTDATGVMVGQAVTGANIPVGATVTSIGLAPTIEISEAATGTDAAQDVSFAPFGRLDPWTDQSGSGLHIPFIAAGVNQPSGYWASSTLNSLPGYVTGQSDCATDPLTTSFSSGALSFFVVGKRRVAMGFLSLDPYAFWQIGQPAYIDAYSTNEVGGDYTNVLSDDEYFIWDAAWRNGQRNYKANGADLVLQGAPYDGGELGPLNDVFFELDGYGTENIVLEIIVYDALLSDANRLAIRQNIATYYGITLS